MTQEIGRIKKSNTAEIVIQVDEFNGKQGITIREFVTLKNYIGFTKKGVRIPIDKWNEFQSYVNKVNLKCEITLQS